MASNSGGANALLVIRETLPGTLAELQAEREKLILQLRKIQEQISEAEMHLAVSPPDSKEETKK